MNAIDIVGNGHLTVLETLDSIDGQHWMTPGVCGVWSIKDIMAHLASFEQVLVDVLHTFLDDTATPHLHMLVAQGDDFNDLQVMARHDTPIVETLEEYHKAFDQIATLLPHLPVETLRQPGTMDWYGTEYALDDLLVYMFYGHKCEHAAQMAAFRDQLARTEHSFFNIWG